MQNKKEDVQALDQWKALLTTDLLVLQHLAGQDAFTRMRRSLKEQEIGQHCCQAGEYLYDLDLSRLKEALGLNEEQWQRYKSKVRPEQE